MNLQAIVLTALLSVGFWAILRTWEWLGAVREALSQQVDELEADC